MLSMLSVCVLLIPACDESDAQQEAKLLKQLRHQDAKHRIEAVYSLSTMQFVSDSIVLALGDALRDKDEDVQIAAAAALKRLGPAAKRATPFLILSLRESTGSLSSYAEDTLIQIGYPAIPGLIKLLEDHKCLVRIKAAGVLGAIGIESRRAEKALVKLLKEEKSTVRFAAAEALVRINKNNRDAIPILTSMLKSRDEELRFRATEGLARSTEGAKHAVPILVDYLYDREIDFNHLQRTLIALWRTGSNAKQCARDLSRLLRDDRFEREPGLRLLAVATLLKMDPQAPIPRRQARRSIPLLITLLDEKSLDLSVLAAETLGRLSVDAKDALPALRKCLKSTHPALSQASKQAIQRIDEGK